MTTEQIRLLATAMRSGNGSVSAELFPLLRLPNTETLLHEGWIIPTPLGRWSIVYKPGPRLRELEEMPV